MSHQFGYGQILGVHLTRTGIKYLTFISVDVVKGVIVLETSPNGSQECNSCASVQLDTA